MTRPCWLRRAVRNWHTDAAVLAPSSGEELAHRATPSRHGVDGVEVDAAIQHERAAKF
jgi:hypothetical protein